MKLSEAKTTILNKEDFHKYPLLSPLLQIKDCPKLLYIKGYNLNLLQKENNMKILCIIGSRKATQYGRDAINYLVQGLTGYNIAIISGLALGTDSEAHKAALKYELPTIALPGSGLSNQVLYPPQNISLAEDILDKNGMLISEYEEDVKSRLYFFPARNRIVAAISDLILVVEAQEKSGTKITIRLALESGKEVAVVPGSIFSVYSKGALQFMKDGAHPVTSSDDILYLLNLKQDSSMLKQKDLFEEMVQDLNEEEKCILNILSSPKGKDELIEESELPIHLALAAITSLEAKGLIRDDYTEVRKII
jgi:DNA processing protein